MYGYVTNNLHLPWTVAGKDYEALSLTPPATIAPRRVGLRFVCM
jgi:hypothetical protein